MARIRMLEQGKKRKVITDSTSTSAEMEEGTSKKLQWLHPELLSPVHNYEQFGGEEDIGGDQRPEEEHSGEGGDEAPEKVYGGEGDDEGPEEEDGEGGYGQQEDQGDEQNGEEEEEEEEEKLEQFEEEEEEDGGGGGGGEGPIECNFDCLHEVIAMAAETNPQIPEVSSYVYSAMAIDLIGFEEAIELNAKLKKCKARLEKCKNSQMKLKAKQLRLEAQESKLAARAITNLVRKLTD